MRQNLALTTWHDITYGRHSVTTEYYVTHYMTCVHRGAYLINCPSADPINVMDYYKVYIFVLRNV